MKNKLACAVMHALIFAGCVKRGKKTNQLVSSPRSSCILCRPPTWCLKLPQCRISNNGRLGTRRAAPAHSHHQILLLTQKAYRTKLDGSAVPTTRQTAQSVLRKRIGGKLLRSTNNEADCGFAERHMTILHKPTHTAEVPCGELDPA